jgi:hypothetical protein
MRFLRIFCKLQHLMPESHIITFSGFTGSVKIRQGRLERHGWNPQYLFSPVLDKLKEAPYQNNHGLRRGIYRLELYIPFYQVRGQ